MQFLSEFEILAQPIAPPVAGEPTVPFVVQGYFCLLSRLEDGLAGDIQVQFTFHPSPGFPAATGNVATDPLLADYEDETGTNQILLSFGGSLTVPVGSGKTVLVGLQPNFINQGIYQAAGNIAVRGYVTVDIVSSPGAPAGLYQLAAAPEIRAVFAAINPAAPVLDLTKSQEVAYCLPVPNAGLISLTKGKDTKDKEASKESKDGKDRKDTKDGAKDKDKDKDRIKEQKEIERPPQAGESSATDSVSGLAARLAAIESLLSEQGETFIGAAQRPQVG